ncbi:MAG: bifunctional 4-hydroxy-2-oxoglutarate aldolase/2-dehydro-3-deoxy-phosphogluconate aldolase [Candidatus Omnitrophota bacterium]|nr:bifunctional 4-hydroxy-2-oxoglutarate aldolase/2-dehydro-3-deoxy-phosphogluconate aldolase [Candidatus Omnitrophota bacterium]
MDITAFQKQPIMGIVRGVSLEQIEPLVEAVIDSGLRTLEITMNTPGAAELIRRALNKARGKLVLGAGTVLNMKDLKEALDAGAAFIVMPVLVKEVAAYCLKYKIPVFPGALTPQEIYQAWQEGATMVKVFPANVFGPEYIREIKGPLNGIKLMAVAGVNPQNIREYFACGASAVAFGGSVFSRQRLQNADYSGITRDIKAYLRELP